MAHHKFAEIDKELRVSGRVGHLVSYPSTFNLRMLHRILSVTVGKTTMVGATKRTADIARSNEDGTIRTLIFAPKNKSEPMPTVLYLHGGGFAIGAPDQNEYIRLMKGLMDKKACVFVAPDYRLSFDDPYPAGVNDCYDVLRWVKENIAELGGRSDQIFVMGDSAGGGLTAAVSLMARDRGDVNIAFQMPLYPMIDHRQVTKSAVNNNMPVWNSKHNKIGWELYLRALVANNEPIPIYASPSLATDYANLPPTASFIGELDPFLDETVAYVENLKAADVPTHFQTFAGCYHGFEFLNPKSDVGKRALAFMHESYAFAVDNYFAENE